MDTKSAGALVAPVSIEAPSMKTVKILRRTVCGGEAVKPGDIVEASPADARFLVAIGKAEYSKPKPKRKAKSAPLNRQIEDMETR